MSLSNPYKLFGVHSVTFFDRTDRTPVGYLRVLGDCSLNLSPEFEDLNGGSQLYSWDSEVKSINSEFSLTAREYPIEVMEMLLAGTKTAYTADADGEVINEANVKGTSVIASTGIASIEVTSGDGADLKEGEYVIEAVSTTTVDIYALSDANFVRGTDATFEDDTMTIASAKTITQDGDTVLADFGLTITGGAGTIAMTIGDTARFTVRRPSVTGVKLVVGQSGATFSEYGALLTGQVMGDGTLQYVELYRVKAAGMPIAFKEKGYSEWSITLKALYDSTRNGVFEFIRNR